MPIVSVYLGDQAHGLARQLASMCVLRNGNSRQSLLQPLPLPLLREGGGLQIEIRRRNEMLGVPPEVE
jgi:hypothetical protein